MSKLYTVDFTVTRSQTQSVTVETNRFARFTTTNADERVPSVAGSAMQLGAPKIVN